MLETTFTFAVPDPTDPLKTRSNLIVHGTGECVVADPTANAEATLHAATTPPAPARMTCAAGASVAGSASFTVSGYGSFDGASTALFVVTFVGGVAAATMTATGADAFVGAGVFVQEAPDTVACVTGAVTTTDWLGEFAFAAVDDATTTAR